MDFTIYEAGSGARPVLRYGHCPDEDIGLQAGEGEACHEGEALGDTDFYFLNGVKKSRPSLSVTTSHAIAADGIDAVAFALPAGSAVYLDAEGLSWLDEDEFHVTSDDAGTFVYRIEPAFPYRGPVEVTIHAA